MIRDYRILMESRHIHKVQMLEKHAKRNCYNIQKLKYKIIDFDDVTNENDTNRTQFKVTSYARSSMQNINNWKLWIRKNKRVTKSDAIEI